MSDNEESDSLSLICERAYNIDALRKYIENSCLKESCPFLEENDLEKIYDGFLELFKGELSLEEIITVFVGACMLYFVDANASNFEQRSHIVQRAFCYVDTMNALHIHVATKHIYDGLKTNDIGFAYNILSIAQQISDANETGRAIAVCLTWALLYEITETQLDMHCFHKLSHITKLLKVIDDEELTGVGSAKIVYILVRCISFLIHAVVFGRNDDFMNTGYRPYFTYTDDDLKQLKEWTEHLCDLLNVSPSNMEKNVWDLRLIICECAKTNIRLLQGKLSDLGTTHSQVI